MEQIKNIISSLDGFASAMVYLLIVLLFIFGFVKCIMPVMRNRATLKRAIRSIKSSDRDRKHSWQEDAFLGKGALLPHWTEYLNNLFFADGVYHNASNVEDYINEETVIYGPGNSGFSDALPGLMVSLGFMGTLIGLAVGLSGFNMGDETAIMTSIETLIPGMRYAFMTSIVGVVGSVSFTLITRFVHGSAQRAITGFYAAMSRHAGVLSVDPLTQVAIYQQEQTALIQTMAKDLNGQFTQRMAQAMQEAAAPLNESLTKFVSVNTQEQMKFLDAITGRFVEHMDGMLQGQFDNLAQVIDRTTRNQEQLLIVVEGSIKSISRSANEMARLEKTSADILTQFEGYMGRLAAAQKQMDDAFGRAAGNIEQLQLVSRQQADYLRSVSGMQNAVAETMDYLREVVVSMQTAATSLQESCDGIESMRESIGAAANESAKQLEAAHRKALRAVDDDMKASFEKLGNYMKDYAARVEESGRALKKAVDGLPGAVSEVSGSLVEQIDRMNASLNRVQRAMDDVVDRMYGK